MRNTTVLKFLEGLFYVGLFLCGSVLVLPLYVCVRACVRTRACAPLYLASLPDSMLCTDKK